MKQTDPNKQIKRYWGTAIIILLFLVADVRFAIMDSVGTIDVALFGVTTTGTVIGSTYCRSGDHPTVRYGDSLGVIHSGSHDALGCTRHLYKIGQPITIQYASNAPSVYRTQDEMIGEPWFSLFLGVCGILLAGGSCYAMYLALSGTL